MNGLNKKDRAELADIASDLFALLAEYETAKTAFEAEAARIVEAMNEKRHRVWEIVDDAHREADEYFDERSEAWQAGERGERYGEWRDELEQLAGNIEDELEPPEVPEIDEPDWLSEVQAMDFAEFQP